MSEGGPRSRGRVSYDNQTNAAQVYNQAVSNLAARRSRGQISQTQFEREMATLEPLRARAGFDTRNEPSRSSRPQTSTGAASTTDPIVDQLNSETADIQNRGLDRSQLGIIKFPSTIETDATPYVLIKMFRSAVGTISPPQNAEEAAAAEFDPATNIVSAIEKAGTAVSTEIKNTSLGSLVNDNITKAGAALNAAAPGVGEFAQRAKSVLTNYQLRRNIEQLSYAIALTMPENLAVSYQNNYDQLSLTAALGGFGLAAQALASTNGKGDNANPFIAEAAGRLAGNILSEDFRKLGLFAATGRTLNPQLELIYNSPALRQFTLDFRMIPRNPEESGAIQSILQILKLEAAPQISAETSSRYFIPPSQFQLEFYDGVNHAMPNSYLFKTKKCVLEDISIDYTGGGSFATFYTGAPVEIRLSLKFTETVIIDRTAVGEGF
jgi:hypothetical protein